MFTLLGLGMSDIRIRRHARFTNIYYCHHNVMHVFNVFLRFLLLFKCSLHIWGTRRVCEVAK